MQVNVTGNKTDPLHSSLGILDRVIRTLRDIAYTMRAGVIDPDVMNEIVMQYNNAPHKGLSKWAGFPVTPAMAQNDDELESFIVRRIAKENERITEESGYKLPVGTPVRVYNSPDSMLKRRTQIQPGRHFVSGMQGSLYKVVDKSGETQLVPRYKLDW